MRAEPEEIVRHDLHSPRSIEETAMEAVRDCPNPSRELDLAFAVLVRGAELKKLTIELARITVRLLTAEDLADEVDALIARRVISERSPAADALLDYRDPPRTERSDRLGKLDTQLVDHDKRMDALAAQVAVLAEIDSYLEEAGDSEMVFSHVAQLLRQAGFARGPGMDDFFKDTSLEKPA